MHIACSYTTSGNIDISFCRSIVENDLAWSINIQVAIYSEGVHDDVADGCINSNIVAGDNGAEVSNQAIGKNGQVIICICLAEGKQIT